MAVQRAQVRRLTVRGAFPFMLPPKRYTGKRHPTSVSLEEDLVEELERIAKATGYTRSEVIHSFIVWAVDEYKKRSADGDKS